MLKYLNTSITFLEVPDEISLCINITNCPIYCKNCHSKFLWDDNGYLLNEESLDKLIKNNDGISCVCFMGGDNDPESVALLAEHVKKKYNLKVAWYSGSSIYDNLNYKYFDFIKIGPYIDELGGLNSKTTNQRFYWLTPISSIVIVNNKKCVRTGFNWTYKFINK